MRKVQSATRPSLSYAIAMFALAALWASFATAAASNTSVYNLVIVDKDGSNPRLVDEATLPRMKFNCMPQWSPDGQSILFDSTPIRGRWLETHLAVYHLMGPNAGKTDDVGLGNAPNWSPDGKKIAYFLNEGSPAGKGGSWTMNADGSDRKWLCKEWYPNWSPDGKTIALTTSFDAAHGIVLCDVATGQTRPFGDGTLKILNMPAWSPDSKKLAVVASWGEDRGVTIYDIERAKVDQILWASREATHGLPPEAAPTDLTWSRDGSEILVHFSMGKGKREELFVFTLGMMKKVEVDPIVPIVFSSNLAPDGKHIVFVSNPWKAPAPKAEGAKADAKAEVKAEVKKSE